MHSSGKGVAFVTIAKRYNTASFFLLFAYMSQSDPNRIVRLIPLIVGGLGGTLLMFNRISTVDLTTTQSRSDALGIFLSAILLLCGMLWQRVQPVAPEQVELTGENGIELQPDLPEAIQTELAWASHSLLTNTPTRVLVVYYQGKTLLRRGILGLSKTVPAGGAIVDRVLKTKKPVYLVDLKLYPGRTEFTYLPENTQGVICQPMGDQGVLILGANAPRSYTKQDEAWVEAIADKLADTLIHSLR